MHRPPRQQRLHWCPPGLRQGVEPQEAEAVAADCDQARAEEDPPSTELDQLADLLPRGTAAAAFAAGPHATAAAEGGGGRGGVGGARLLRRGRGRHRRSRRQRRPSGPTAATTAQRGGNAASQPGRQGVLRRPHGAHRRRRRGGQQCRVPRVQIAVQVHRLLTSAAAQACPYAGVAQGLPHSIEVLGRSVLVLFRQACVRADVAHCCGALPSAERFRKPRAGDQVCVGHVQHAIGTQFLLPTRPANDDERVQGGREAEDQVRGGSAARRRQR
mmetsp:Transcript_76407/g.247891  ORF Transcript_76407/g.247891 Transcript_76407/m.247891 type:complete len:272 (+) Transcript_76407:437-1252(+)